MDHTCSSVFITVVNCSEAAQDGRCVQPIVKIRRPDANESLDVTATGTSQVSDFNGPGGMNHIGSVSTSGHTRVRRVGSDGIA